MKQSCIEYHVECDVGCEEQCVDVKGADLYNGNAVKQWNNVPCRMSSIAKSGRASYKEDTMRSETGEQCKKLWIGMMRYTIAKKL